MTGAQIFLSISFLVALAIIGYSLLFTRKDRHHHGK